MDTVESALLLASPNYLWLNREKMTSRFVSVTSEEITQINDGAVPENTKKVTKFELAVFKGNGLSF